MSSVIGAIRDYIQSYQALEKDVPVWVDMLGADVTSYSVHTMPGKIVEEDIIGNKTVIYPFAFGSVESTAEQNETLETAEFYETFAEWDEPYSIHTEDLQNNVAKHGTTGKTLFYSLSIGLNKKVYIIFGSSKKKIPPN